MPITVRVGWVALVLTAIFVGLIGIAGQAIFLPSLLSTQAGSVGEAGASIFYALSGIFFGLGAVLSTAAIILRAYWYGGEGEIPTNQRNASTALWFFGMMGYLIISVLIGQLKMIVGSDLIIGPIIFAPDAILTGALFLAATWYRPIQPRTLCLV